MAKGKYFKFFIIILAVAVIVPQVAMAAWWNPFTWGWLNRIFHFQQAAQKAPAVSVSLSDEQIADAIFPSSKWVKFRPENYRDIKVAYKPKNQKGDLPLYMISLVKRGDPDKDSREDALVRVEFGGADSASMIKFVYNSSTGPVNLNFPSKGSGDLGVDFEAGKTGIKDFGFTDNGFHVLYTGNFNDNQQRIDYKISNGQIVEFSRGSVLTPEGKTLEQACLAAGGKVSTANCYCSGPKDFYNTCAIGACTCTPDPKNKKTLKICECGEGKCWQGNQCVSFSRDENGNIITNPILGGDKDAHGCIGSAGYTWCEVKKKCLRTWEEKCEADSTAGWKKYTNIEYGFEIKYPSNWNPQLAWDNSVKIPLTFNSADKVSEFDVVNRIGGGDKTIQEMFDSQVSGFTKIVKNKTAIKIGDYNGYEVVGLWGYGNVNALMSINYAYSDNNFVRFVYSESSPANDISDWKHYNEFKQILSTFKFTK